MIIHSAIFAIVDAAPFPVIPSFPYFRFLFPIFSFLLLERPGGGGVVRGGPIIVFPVKPRREPGDVAWKERRGGVTCGFKHDECVFDVH